MISKDWGVAEGWGFKTWLPESASSYAPQIDYLMTILHVVMIGIFVVWGVYFIYCLIAYRAREGRRGEYHQTGEKASFLPDALILAFEMWLILAFGIPVWTSVKQSTPPLDEANQVHVVAQQFAWNFHYPGPDGKFGRRDVTLVTASNAIGLDDADPAAKDDFVTINNLMVPLGKPTVLQMTSKDVIHDFWVSNFRNKQDVVPGLQTNLWFDPTKTGKFEIACAQLCGLGHTQMVGNVFVQSAEEFGEWQKGQLSEKQGTASVNGSVPAGEGRS